MRAGTGPDIEAMQADWERAMRMPVVTLTNGFVIGNFSSPHPFAFTDGTVLPRCSTERVQQGKLECIEKVMQKTRRGISYEDLALTWKLTESVRELLVEGYRLWEEERVDFILIPFPVMTAKKSAAVDQFQPLMNASGLPFNPCDEDSHPFRVVRVADREAKTIFVDRFCC